MVDMNIRKFLPEADLLPYIEAILGVYNLHERRDNKCKARIKIMLHEHIIEAFTKNLKNNSIVSDQPIRKVISTTLI